jgi:hypothetical protein
VGALVVAWVTRPDWLSDAGSWPWYLVAVAVAVGLVALSGLTPRAVISGDLAFVLGPTPRSHGSARVYASMVGAVGEELLFRAPGVLWVSSTPLALLGAVGFVGRHHVQPGSNRRGSVRSTAAELTGAAALLGLTVLSHSIYPALVAHVLNNLPLAAVEFQRENGRFDIE